MQNVIGRYLKKYQDWFYVVFRVFVGLLFFQHGAQKLFGWFGSAGTAESLSLFWFAGVIEVVGGLFLAAGVFTRLVAALGALEMVVAYFKVHNPVGLIPIVNKGELALLFLAAFLIIAVEGASKASLELAVSKKEMF